MRDRHKRSKITTMRDKGRATSVRSQQGMASIIVVSVLIIIMTLISIGFARLVNRTATSSADRQFSASASYGAQSGINDVASYLKTYVKNNPNSAFLPQSTKCNGAGSLIGSSASPGPFYNDSNLSNDPGRTTQYTCLLLNPTPSTLLYTQVTNLKSQVVKVNTSAAAGALDKLMISWQPSNPSITAYPPATKPLSDETAWNTGLYTPMLRLTVYPVSKGESLTSPQTQSKTVFLYPQAASGTVPVKAYTDNVNFKDGSTIAIPCTKTIASGTFNPSGTANYNCNIIIKSLSGAIAPANTDSVYLRITPIYNQADVQLAANDKFGDSVEFIYDQAVVDVTAQTGGVAKRLQARLDTSSLDISNGGVDTNISSNSDTIPEQSVRTAISLCKREIETIYTSIGFSSFVNFDDPDPICHDLSTNTTNPVPTLTFGITGTNGPDNGKSVDSQANNPDSPQNPVQQGTVYVGTSPGGPGTAKLDWTTTDATNCAATLGSAGWPGEKNGIMTFTGNPPTNGAGSQSFSVTNKTNYSLQCSRPFAPSPTPVKTVTIWPYPHVTGLTQSPNPVKAGANYAISWTSASTSRCVLSGGNWSNPSNTATSGSETMNWPVNDNTTHRVFTVTCYDPINRSDTATITVIPSHGGNCNGGNPCQVDPPVCNATFNYSGTDINNAKITWSTSCAYWDAVNPALTSRYISTNVPGIPNGYTSASGWASGTVNIRDTGQPHHGVGPYYFQIYVWATPWANESTAAGTSCSSNCPGYANTGNQKFIVHAPPVHVKIGDPNDTSLMDNTKRYRSYKTSQNNGPNDCRDSVHNYAWCFSLYAYQGDTESYGASGTGFYVIGCNVSPSLGFLGNYNGVRHWSQYGYWKNEQVGWNVDLTGWATSPLYNPKPMPYDGTQISATCTGIIQDYNGSGYYNPTGTATDSTQWVSCGDRDQTGIYYSDVGQNGCN
jgi:hypothetical protein